MWSIALMLSFCFFFWLAQKEQNAEQIEEVKKEDKDMGPLAVLYFSEFWEDD